MCAGLVAIFGPMATRRERERLAKKKLVDIVRAELADVQKNIILLSSAIAALEEDQSTAYRDSPFFEAARRAASRVNTTSWTLNNKFYAWNKHIKEILLRLEP